MNKTNIIFKLIVITILMDIVLKDIRLLCQMIMKD